MCEFILLCEEHYNPLGLVRSLGENNIFPVVIVVKNKRKLVSKSRYIKRLVFVNSLEDGLQHILDNYGKTDKDVLYVCDDKTLSLIDEIYDDIKKRFITFNAGSSNVINYYLQKKNIQKLANECGFKIPSTRIINRKEQIPDDITYPIITKAISSISGGWKKDVFICHNKQELLNAIPKIKSENIALQEYLIKDNELCLDGFSYNRGKDVFVSIASTYDYLIDNSYSPLMTIKNFEDVDKTWNISKKLNNIFSVVGFEGIFSVEFLIVGNELYFLEINFRNSTWSYASTKCGMNLPIMWYEAMTGKATSFQPQSIKNGYKAMVEPTDFAYRVMGGRISLFKWLKERKECDCLYYKNKKDKKPTRFFMIRKLIKIV